MNENKLMLILNNVRSVFNVGSLFRTADAAGVAKIYLCGYTPVPETRGRKLGNERIAKTALSAEKSVPWEYIPHAWRLIDQLQKDGIHTIALEQSPQAVDYRIYKSTFPLALIVGNEVKGLRKEILERCTTTITLPMRGEKESLNVAVAAGIALYKLQEKVQS